MHTVRFNIIPLNLALFFIIPVTVKLLLRPICSNPSWINIWYSQRFCELDYHQPFFSD